METSKQKLQPNPRDDANIFAILFFTWTIPLFKRGCSKSLEIEDVCQPRKNDKSTYLGDKIERLWTKYRNGKIKTSLLKIIAKAFWKEFLLLSVLCLINDVIIKILLPQLLRRFLLYFGSDSNVDHSEAIVYASAMVLLNGIGALTINQLFITGYHNGMKVRVAVSSMIYRKALLLSHAALECSSPGKVVNLLSNDVGRFDAICLYINSMWTAPLLVCIVGYLLWLEVGLAGMFGLLVVFIVVPLQSYTGKLSSKFRFETAQKTDERVRFMDEIISGVQVIKMYAWERPFTQLITIARKLELDIVRKNAYVRALYMTFAMFTTRMAIFSCCMSIFLLYGEENITAAKVFAVASYFSVIAQTMSQMFVRGVAEIAEGLVAIKRIQEFMESEEKTQDAITPNGHSNIKNNPTTEKTVAENNVPTFHPLPSNNDMENFVIHIRNMYARWVSDEEMPFKLENINLEFRKRGKIVGIVGSVGSGKSSLLQALLRELPIESGQLKVHGSISYASQDSWVFSSSARQNILFGEKMDRKRYDAVIKACALEKDFERFEYGDRTLVGERGTSLSGGQKARINLARAVYRKADIYLLDDPLSAVDAHVASHIFNECIGPNGILGRQKATRILVTHQVHFLKRVDWLVILRNGKIQAQGQPQDLSIEEFDLSALTCDDEYRQEDNNNQRRRKISRISIKSLSASSLSSDYEGIRRESEFDPGLIESLQVYEESVAERSQGSVFRKYFESGANRWELFVIFLLFILAQLACSAVDFWVSFWISQEEKRTYADHKTGLNETEFQSNIEQNNSVVDTDTCVVVYSILIASLFIVAITRSISFYNVCIKASQSLHDNMFVAILSTVLRFFNINPSGRILNRFARDIGSVDEMLPRVLLDAIQTNLNMIGAIILTSIVNPIFLLPLFVISFAFLYVRKVYLKTSKNIKRLEGISRSPVYSHLSVSLDGISTIRAFNAEKILIEEFDAIQDTHSACWYTFISTSSAFGFVLDVMCFFLVFVVIFSFILFDTGVRGDKVGLAITQMMTMTGMLQWGIRHSVEVSNQLISVERILEYGELEAEKQPQAPIDVDSMWPNDGKIEFCNVTYRYCYETEPVLRRISFVVHPKEKIGIVGRTGAGKSSLIGALLRMADVKGTILIDGVDTSAISLQKLRSKIAIIPQDPVLFSGTLRLNLDPFNEYADIDIYNALEEIKMRHLGSSAQGLNMPVLAHGSNFSIGQRQLLCLARAILRKNRILVLDEATANVDPQTDELIQQTIRSKFADCTVLTVAHRLNTIIDSDRILVLEAGKSAEFDSPYNLLTKTSGNFKEMVQTLGPKEFQRFLNISSAKQNSPKSQ